MQSTISLCVVSYYGPIEAIYHAEKWLRKSDQIKVYDFPMYKYINDPHDKINDYVKKFIEFIQDNKIDIILWWFMNVSTDIFIEIKNKTNVKYAIFNWDEPHNWPYVDMINKMPYIDISFVTCQETLEKYQENGCNHAFCLYPGYEPEINYPIMDINMQDYNKYNCDISFCCTNLYDDSTVYPDQYIKRKELVDTIYNGQEEYEYSFHIYGPIFLKDMYPKSYKGFIKYEELNKLFNYSKINLCTHVQYKYFGYLNERVILIGGSGGLLLVDKVNGIDNIFDKNNEIILLQKENYVNQICEILNNYGEFIDYRKNLGKKCSQNYTYQKWAEFINNEIMKLFCQNY